jgi:hypothetical protein
VPPEHGLLRALLSARTPAAPAGEPSRIGERLTERCPFILFACDRLSRAGEAGVRAVAAYRHVMLIVTDGQGEPYAVYKLRAAGWVSRQSTAPAAPKPGSPAMRNGRGRFVCLGRCSEAG